MNAPLQLYLIRHGETAWSLSGPHTGRTDLPLTAHGEHQALALRPMLQPVTFSFVRTSPMLRARSTCDLAGLGSTATVDRDLSEWDYGDYEGLRTVQIQQAHPHWNVWRAGCPGGESVAQVAARADRLLTRVQALQGNVALFSHGQFARVLAARWIGLSAEHGQHFAVDPASIGILGHEPAHPQRRTVSLWNAVPALLNPPPTDPSGLHTPP